MVKWFKLQWMKDATMRVLAGRLSARLRMGRGAALVERCAFGCRSRRGRTGGATMMALDDRLLADMGIRRSDLVAAANGMLDLNELARAPGGRDPGRCMISTRFQESGTCRLRVIVPISCHC